MYSTDKVHKNNPSHLLKLHFLCVTKYDLIII